MGLHCGLELDNNGCQFLLSFLPVPLCQHVLKRREPCSGKWR